jgi:hydrogenase/urease accessory protein HupE
LGDLAGFFLDVAAFRAAVGRATAFRATLRAALFLTVFFVLEALTAPRLRAAGLALPVDRRRPFLRTAAFGRFFVRAAFFAALRFGRA